MVTRRVQGDFPAPVLTAIIEITGFVDFNIVVFGPINRKSAPDAKIRLALCITSSNARSEYASIT